MHDLIAKETTNYKSIHLVQFFKRGIDLTAAKETTK